MAAGTGSRIAVVGAGAWGRNHVRVWGEIGALAAVCDTDTECLSAVRNDNASVALTTDFAELLRDNTIDGIVIAAPAEHHASMVRQALLAGKDVLVEKPLALSVDSGRALVDLARKSQRILMVGHILWYHPAILKLREIVASGVIGRIQYIYSNRLNLGRIRREENILWSFAPHDISVILGLAGEMPVSVKAQGGNYLHERVADVTVSLLAFHSGMRAHLFVSWLHPFKEQKLVIVGDRQMAVFDDLEKERKLVLYPHNMTWKNQLPVFDRAEAQPVDFRMEEPLRAECLHFLECIATRRTPRTSGDEALRVLTVLDQCEKAVQESTSVVAESLPAPLSYSAHKSAFIDEDVEIGEGTSIWHVSHILKGSRIGRNCRIGQNVVVGPRVTVGDGVKIQNNVSIYEGVTLEDSVFCGPSMVFTNVFNPRSDVPRMNELRATRVQVGASLGANCTIVCGVTIGRYAFIGAGAVVTRDVPDFALVYGNPAKIRGWICECGVPLSLNSSQARCSCGKEYVKDEVGVHRK